MEKGKIVKCVYGLYIYMASEVRTIASQIADNQPFCYVLMYTIITIIPSIEKIYF